MMDLYLAKTLTHFIAASFTSDVKQLITMCSKALEPGLPLAALVTIVTCIRMVTLS